MSQEPTPPHQDITTGQTKEYGVYHWDTFDEPGNDTELVAQADDWVEAMEIVYKLYGERLDPAGADQVHIIRKIDGRGVVVEKFFIR